MTRRHKQLSASYEWQVLKEYLCSEGATVREVNQAIREYAYRRLLTERCVPLRKAA